MASCLWGGICFTVLIRYTCNLQRSNETMHTAGRKEIDVLTRLGREDPEGKKHICKLLSHFEYKGEPAYYLRGLTRGLLGTNSF
jgi:hypothetical protein